MRSRPIVGLSADLKFIDPHGYHCVGDKYVRAVGEVADALPVLLPALTEGVNVDEILAAVDGLVFTGSYANIHPQNYNGGAPYKGSLLDVNRDAATLRLIPAALANGVPVFGLCRGFQEMNVALGGTLHQKVHEVPGFDYHLEDSAQSLEVQYGPAHPVYLEKGGLLARLSGSLEQSVNSLHGQGIDQLASGVSVEARAGDGLIEGFTVDSATTFALAVQWHPEWKPVENPFYAALWAAFGTACRERAREAANC